MQPFFAIVTVPLTAQCPFIIVPSPSVLTWNAWQIKNVFRTARAVAQLDREALSIKRLIEAIKSAKKAFEEIQGPGYRESRQWFV